MICAYMKPWAEGILVRIDAMAFRGRLAMRSLLLAGERSARSPAWHGCPSLQTIVNVMLRLASIGVLTC